MTDPASQAASQSGRRTRSVTIKDVAALADVSLSTASLVLNNRPGTTEAMRQKVIEAAETLGFRPNRMAQALRAGHGRHFAILVPDISNPFYGELLAGIASATRRIEHNVFIIQSAEHGTARDADLEAVFESRCAGLIMMDVVEDDRARLVHLMERGMPLVQMIRHLDGLEADSVRSDEAAGGALAMRHALAMGHRRIAVLSGPQSSSASAARREGYVRTLNDAGLAPLQLIETPLTRAAGYEVTGHLLSKRVQPDAIVCGNDLIALGAIDAVMDAGLRVPQDVAIIGYDDMAFASARPVALTTVHQPLQEMGATAISLLIQRIREPSRPAQTVILPHYLAIRRSCGNPAKGQPA